MYVIKRSGLKENVQFDKITSRLQKLLYGGLDEVIDPVLITQKICSRIYTGITTVELDNLASQICMSMITEHPNFGDLASRIVISNHQKNTKESMLDVVTELYNNKDIHNELASLLNHEIVDIVTNNSEEIQNMIDMKRDYLLDYFGFKTLERSYLLKVNNGKSKKIVERPQHLFMRVAIGIHGDDLANVKKTYDNMSLKKYTHATPTLFNASTNHSQLSSCFLINIEDSIEGIFKTYTDCGLISKWAGGIGVHISNIRSKGSYIRKTGGNSDGLVPLLRTFNSIARQFNQGGKRLGSFAMYLEVHHADIFEFLEAKKNHGAEEERARDLFYALWVCDLFMSRVEKNGDWYLMDPNESYGLNEVYGEEYDALYNRYVDEGKYKKKIKARELWEAIIGSQVETGTPYICYKDHVNRKSNQKNIGVIKSSNLCVSGDTQIQVRKGNVPIVNLVDQEVEVWNGKQFSKTTIRKTGENQKLLKITFSNSVELKCTEYHKFYIQENGSEVMYEAHNLKTGMYIIPYERWSTDGKNKLTFRDIYVTKIEECIEKEDTYCFNEPLEHKGIFNGIITGQCAEINEVSNEDETSVCNLGSICLPQVLEYADFRDSDKLSRWKNELSPEQTQLASYYENSELKIYTSPDCDYCKLLKVLLNDCGLDYTEIDKDEAENLRIYTNSEPFETIPQLFSVKNSDVKHLGGYDNNWSVLSPKINYNKLSELAYELTVNLNKVIDRNYYPTERTKRSNMRHRPIGLGVQGLADVFMILKLPFTSDEARKINKELFETIYYGSMSASIDMAEIDGPYSSFADSPLSKGQFQFNLWDIKDEELSRRWNWETLREKMMRTGTRNSLNIALMPTASTASIFGNIESFEAITSNLYTRNVLSGVFTMINKYLVKDLISLEVWDQDTKDRLLFNKGSVQNIRKLPKFLREVYKTSFEIDQKLIIKMSAERGAFVCQSQSLNLFFDKPSFKELTACHFYGWKNGLKTGSYYIRTKSALSGQNFGLDPNKEKMLKDEKIVEEDEGCLSCGA